LQSRLSERHSLLPVIVMTGQADVKLAVRAMKAGAVDFLEKPFNETQLLDAIRRALAANEQALAAAAEAGEAANRLAVLTRREREVLDLLVTGKSTKEIANIIGGSPRTIDVHRARVFGKLGAASLPDLVELMRRAHSAGPP
jgi:two-component system response regulator FixJ